MSKNISTIKVYNPIFSFTFKSCKVACCFDCVNYFIPYFSGIFAMDSTPKCVKLMSDLAKPLPYLNLQAEFFERSKKVFMISRGILILNFLIFKLKISIASSCRFF